MQRVSDVTHQTWPILAYSMDGGRKGCFSRVGDSGSAVWDLKLRLAAMLDGGSADVAEGTGHDISYTTPMKLVHEHIQRRFGRAEFM